MPLSRPQCFYTHKVDTGFVLFIHGNYPIYHLISRLSRSLSFRKGSAQLCRSFCRSREKNGIWKLVENTVKLASLSRKPFEELI